MSGLKLIGALSPLKLLPSANNVLQPLQQTQNNDTNKNRNQNLLKAVNVTSARADSTGLENLSTFNTSSLGPVKSGGKRSRGKASKSTKNPAPSETVGEESNQESAWDKDGNVGPVKIVKHHHSVKKYQTPSVSRRNARERNRVKQVNSGFCILKDHVPHLKNKTSKVDTLRAAVDYIKNLRELLGEPLGQVFDFIEHTLRFCQYNHYLGCPCEFSFEYENNLFQGPVLITELEDHPSNNKGKNNQTDTKNGETVSSTTSNSTSLFDFDPSATDTSFNTSELSSISPTERSNSAQSNPDSEVANMVYQLPPMSIGHATALGQGDRSQQHFQFTGIDIQSPGSPTLSHISSGSGSSSLGSALLEMDTTKTNFDIMHNQTNENMGMTSSQTVYNLPNIHTLRNVDWTTTWQPQE